MGSPRVQFLQTGDLCTEPSVGHSFRCQKQTKWPVQGLDPSRPEHPQLPHLLKPEKLPNGDEACSPVRGPGGNLSTDGSEGRHHLEFQLRHQGERTRRREREREGTGEFEAHKFNSSHHGMLPLLTCLNQLTFMPSITGILML